MPDIVALLQCFQPFLAATTLRQFSKITLAMLAMTGRVTMLGISRWTGQGGSYRTVQRFFYTALPWATLFWVFFRQHLYRPDEVYLLAGDEVVVSKAGKWTHGLDRFFASLFGRPIPGLALFTLALISTQARRSSPVCMEQVVRSEAEKAASQAKKAAKQAPKPAEPRKPGRPKGSKNKVNVEVVLSPELLRIKAMLEGQLKTRIYQIQALHKEFSLPLNVAIIVKTNLQTQACVHVVLFSSDLALAYDKLIDYYRLRFQIEFNFRDTKQYWGLKDFMNVSETAVTNAANLSLFMVNLSQRLLHDRQPTDPDCSILDLKALCRGTKYVAEAIEVLPQKPEPVLLVSIFNKLASLGRIHVGQPTFISP